MTDGKVDLIALNNENLGLTGLGLEMTFLSDGKCRLSWQPTPSAMTPFGHLFVGSMSLAMDTAANRAAYSTVDAREGNVQLRSRKG